MQPIYEATARIEIDRENDNAIHFADSAQDDGYFDLENYIVTQSKILQSETLAMLTVKSMGLDRLPQFGGQPGKPVKAPENQSDAARGSRRVPWRLEHQARAQHPPARCDL